MSNRKKLRRRRLLDVPARPELRRMTVRNERGDDVSWLFGVPPELRGGPQLPGRGRSVRLVDEHGRTLADSNALSSTAASGRRGVRTDVRDQAPGQ